MPVNDKVTELISSVTAGVDEAINHSKKVNALNQPFEPAAMDEAKESVKLLLEASLAVSGDDNSADQILHPNKADTDQVERTQGKIRSL